MRKQIYTKPVQGGMSPRNKCIFISDMRDVAWLMTQNVTNHGEEYYRLASELWEKCEDEINFSAKRVNHVLEGMKLVLEEMPQNDLRVAYILQFIGKLRRHIKYFAAWYDS